MLGLGPTSDPHLVDVVFILNVAVDMTTVALDTEQADSCPLHAEQGLLSELGLNVKVFISPSVEFFEKVLLFQLLQIALECVLPLIKSLQARVQDDASQRPIEFKPVQLLSFGPKNLRLVLNAE